MRSSPPIRDLRFVPASAPLRCRGLLGWTSLTRGDLQLDCLAVRRTADGRHALSFPARTDQAGEQHPYYRPVDRQTQEAIEAEVLGELRRRGVLP